MEDYQYYDGDPDGFLISSFSPTPQAQVDMGAPQAPCTQVHMRAVLVNKMAMVWRFKGTGTIDSLIDALIKHREEVWGKRP